MKKIKTVAIHDGKFHADDVFAIALLKLIKPRIKVIRTRDDKKLQKSDMRIDVGKKYNPSTLDFDHHQKEGSGNRPNGTPYASAGLIWKHYWKYFFDNEDDYKKLDNLLFQGIDADDNGIKDYYKLKIKPYTLYHIIEIMNPSWDEKKNNYKKQFNKAVKFAKQIIKKEIKNIKAQKEAINIIKNSIKNSINKNKEYLILDKYCPWKYYIINNTEYKFVIYPNSSNSNWHIQAVPISLNTIETRKDFPKQWGGLEKEELYKKTKIKDVIFSHKNNFLVITKTKESAIEITKLALKN